jgi:outer membrane protein TolC
MAVKQCVLVWFVLLSLALAGCSANFYRKSADKEAAKVIAEKTPAVPNMDPHFTIVQTNAASLENLPKVEQVEEFLGAEKGTELGASVLNLEQALELAVEHNRDYQNQKEIVYLEALSLTLDRHRYTPIFSSGASSTVQNQPKDVAKAIDELAGTQSSLLQRDTEVVQRYNVSGHGSAAASVLLRSGATLASSFTVDFLRFLNGDVRLLVSSSLGATITQPLLQGAGYRATMENLTQAERDLLYALRDFTQYRKDFSVRVAQSYYGVLQARDEARNQYLGYTKSLQNVTRGRALAQEGRTSQAELGQLEQEALSAETQWISAIMSYRQSLDQFKILLGLPTDVQLVLEERDLSDLKIVHPDLSAEAAVKVALATRLDLQTVRDRKADAARKVYVASNGLKPRVDLVVGGTVDNKPDSANPFDLDLKRARGNAGLNLDPALDRKQQRNNYRSTLIAQARADRQCQLQEDQVKLQIYDDWRNLDQAKRNHEISELGVKLAERRVEEQELLAELGRGQARDLLEAQRALISSRNSRTSAVVRHTLARLQFWRDMGILFIKENGKWEEVANAKQ